MFCHTVVRDEIDLLVLDGRHLGGSVPACHVVNRSSTAFLSGRLRLGAAVSRALGHFVRQTGEKVTGEKVRGIQTNQMSFIVSWVAG